MLRKLATVLVFAAAACGPVPTVTLPPPSPVTLTAAFETLTPLGTITLTVSPAPSVTVQPTPDVPYASFHPIARGVESINVLESVCESRATTWNVYSWGMVQSFDDAGNKACIVGRTL